jgi:DNA modification methylase
MSLNGIEIWNYGHPAMFPEELVERILKLLSYKGDIVVDPFGGVGTTGVVCKRLGRNFLCIDLDKKYCEVAERRIKETPIDLSLF